MQYLDTFVSGSSTPALQPYIMNEPDIVFSITGDLYRNSRALKQIRSLSAYGLRIHVLSLLGSAPVLDLPAAVTVEQLRTRRKGGYRYFQEIHSLMSNAIGKIDAACYHASDLYVLPATAKAAADRGAVYTYDARELYPHVSATKGRPWIRWYWSIVEERHIRGAAAVFTVSKHIADHLQARYRIRKPILVRNVPPKSHASFSGKLASLAGVDESVPIILHLGQMRADRGCETLARSMAAVDHGKLIFLGYGPERERLQRLTQDLELQDRVSFVDPVPPDEILSYAAGAHVGVTLLEDTCLNHRYALPNKLFDYLAAGVPVLASNLPEMRAIVQGYNVGKTVDPESESSVSETLNYMLSSKSERSVWISNASRFCETFNWESASQRFIRPFRTLIQSSDAGRNDRPRGNPIQIEP